MSDKELDHEKMELTKEEFMAFLAKVSQVQN